MNKNNKAETESWVQKQTGGCPRGGGGGMSEIGEGD